MDDNTKNVLTNLIELFFLLCCIAGCVTCNYFDNNCDKSCRSKTEQVKSE